MKRHQITDSDIVDTILGQATSQTEESVQAARENSGFAATYDEWTRILGSAKSDAQCVEATTQRVNASVMESIRLERLHDRASESEQSGFGAQWPLRVSWRGILVPLVPALAVISIAALQLSPVEVSSPVRTLVTYVDFSVSEAAESGSENSLYNTLEKAIQATSKGGTILIRPTAGGVTLSRTIRIARPLRIQSQNAEVGDGAG